MAIEGDHVFLALESPGADIVGFEYAARTDDEKAAVEAAIELLGKPLQWMQPDAAAGCEVEHASAGLEGEAHDEHEGRDEHEGHEEHEGRDEHEGHEEHAEHEQQDSHGDDHGAFVGEYELHCDDIDALTAIALRFFERFPRAQVLEIVLIDSGGQRREKIDRNDPVLRLSR
jgi:ABC-type Zn2+ transport system substrate-binding protein/surface adhesin